MVSSLYPFAGATAVIMASLQPAQQGWGWGSEGCLPEGTVSPLSSEEFKAPSRENHIGSWPLRPAAGLAEVTSTHYPF